MKRIFPLLLVFCLFDSCFDQNDCIISSTNLIKVDLVTLAGVERNVQFNVVRQDSLGKNGTDTIRFPFYEDRSLTALELPLDAEHDTSFYTFVTSTAAKYKLMIRYTSYSRVISTDCGAFLYYKDLNVVSSGFGKTQVVEPELFKSVTTNIKLFF